MAGKVVCVTGAAGYIASWLVNLLLDRGYTVRGTVRSLDDPSKTEHLKALEGAQERLQLFEANLLDQGSFDAVIDGCDGVFHTASPILLQVDDPQVELIEPAVKGTLNVLTSSLKAKTVKRVVLTSSIATVSFKRIAPTSEDLVDETWFSDADFCEETKMWYILSKILAEEAATKFAAENGMDLVVLNPGFVIGPLLQPTLNTTTSYFLTFIREGYTDAKSGNAFIFVDVRDVAYAHVAAFEEPSANGRYCLVTKVLSWSQTRNILRCLYPTLKSPTEIQTTTFQVCTKKAKTLGLSFISAEQSMKDTFESLREKKLFSIEE